MPACIRGINRELEKHKITHEILVIDDGSTDSTQSVLTEIGREIPELVSLFNDGENGFGCFLLSGLN
mgnify:CR=1 FL=1